MARLNKKDKDNITLDECVELANQKWGKALDDYDTAKLLLDYKYYNASLNRIYYSVFSYRIDYKLYDRHKYNNA